MRGRGLRGDIRQDNYGRILDADPVGARAALADAGGPTALTAFEQEQREAKKVCRVFTTEGRNVKVCDRCGHDYEAHRSAARLRA